MARTTRSLLLVLVVAGLSLAACGGDDSDTGTAQPNAARAAVDATVGTAETADGEEMLVAANGHTLYLFEKDSGTTTACTGGCADVWPALSASSPTASAGVDASKMSTVEGQVPDHVVYAGHLLYFFSGDKAPGDVNGASIPAWYPVSPAGEKIDHDDAAPASTTDGGTGY